MLCKFVVVVVVSLFAALYVAVPVFILIVCNVALVLPFHNAHTDNSMNIGSTKAYTDVSIIHLYWELVMLFPHACECIGFHTMSSQKLFKTKNTTNFRVHQFRPYG